MRLPGLLNNRPKMEQPTPAPTLQQSPGRLVIEAARTARASSIFCMVAVRFATEEPEREKISSVASAAILADERCKNGLKPQLSGHRGICGRARKAALFGLARSSQRVRARWYRFRQIRSLVCAGPFLIARA